MTNIPKLGKYVNDEIAYELHKLKTDEIRMEYHKSFELSDNNLFYFKSGVLCNYANYRTGTSSLYRSIFIHRLFVRDRIDVLDLSLTKNLRKKLPKKYWYTSGKESEKGYFD